MNFLEMSIVGPKLGILDMPSWQNMVVDEDSESGIIIIIIAPELLPGKRKNPRKTYEKNKKNLGKT